MPLVRRAFLGAELPPDAEAFTPAGMRIAGVVDGGMAARAELAAGDTVLAIAGLPVTRLCDLAAALRSAAHTHATTLAFEREGDRIERTIEVDRIPEEPGVEYGDVAGLRTLVTMPAAPRALVAFIQGIACESIDQPFADTPLEALVAAWTAAGFATLRFDKRGVGDSDGGPCRDGDFAQELADATRVIEHAAELARARGIPLVIAGHSVGGIIAPHLAAHARALIVYGTPVMPWLECLNDSIRRQLELRGASAHVIADELAKLAQLTEAGELNGRSARYHAQLAEVDIAAAWRAVDVPVLVVRGEHDWVVRADDQARIASLARGTTTIVDVPGLDHLFGWHPDRAASLRDYGVGLPADTLAHVTIEWLGSIL